ncbi:MAG: EAL domain-containing protein [Terrimicrobiaceae bacterium]|nr:EAL domain-containing protein [Terrimicrobiaceae bacterium]
MRNRTAIRLLYILAVLAGILPPLLFLGYAFRQSVSQVDHELDFVGSGAVLRTDSVLDTVGSTLRKVAGITHGRVDNTTIGTLRQAVFLDRYVQAIAIRDNNRLLCASDRFYDQPGATPAPRAKRLPPPGAIEVQPDARGLPTKSLVIVYSFAEGLAVEGLINPDLLNEFFDHYARESGCRVFLCHDGEWSLTAFGKEGVAAPRHADLSPGNGLQWRDGQLVRVSHSKKYPIYSMTAADSSVVTAKWTRSAAESAVGGIVVSALLSGLVIRVAKRTQSLESDLREAVKFDEIDVHYQPIIDLSTNLCIGAEALLRWNHPRRGMIPAGEFIAIAERTGLILPMTDVLLKKIAVSLGSMLHDDPAIHITINLAPQHFATTRIIDSVATLTQTALPAAQLIFEITERGLVDDDAVARAVMNGLAATGARLAVDDFGTGYSSLSYLQRFPLDFLKVDKAFVDGISSPTESSGLVDQIIRIANSLDLEIIAEGVEQGYQTEYLKARGVRYAQGWYFGHPMPARKFMDFVRIRNQGMGARTTLPGAAPDIQNAPADR